MALSTRSLTALILGASLILTGCFAVSKNPLSTPATSTIDSRLEGVFVARREKNDEDLAVEHFHYRREKSETGGQPRATPWLEIMDIEHDRSDGLRGAAYRALTVHLGGHDYMSIVELGTVSPSQPGSPSPRHVDKTLPTVYQLLRYEVGAFGELRLWFADTAALKRAVEAGKIHGQVSHQKPIMGVVDTDTVVITDSTEHLASFVAASDPTVLFGGKPAILYRLTR